ncbi:MAG TPA: dihydrodipicolinate synthase family protein [Chloroflexota bacterium]|nr:dihydrodipicolinate synthase family protein [Chloroflexota bacterium]
MTRHNGGTDAAWAWTEALSGVIPPLITPLHAEGRIDVPAIGTLVDHLLAGGCSGLFVVGGCGLGPWLTMAQRGETIRAMAEAARGRAPVLAGVMLPATGPAREAARQAEAEGADALVVGSPYYYWVDGDDQRRHVEALLTAVRIPVLLYNIPQCTAHSLSPETVAALAREPRVLGIKDSSGNLSNFQSLVAIKRQRPDFRVLQGDERVMAPCLLMGGDGLIPGAANVAPRYFVDLVRAAARGDVDACRRQQELIQDLWTLFSYGRGLSGLYAACAAIGIGSGEVVEPWIAPDATQQQAILEILRRHDLLAEATVGKRWIRI